MAIDVGKLIAAISPEVYCKSDKRDDVKSITRREGFLKAAEAAELVDASNMDFEEANLVNPFAGPGQSNPIEQHSFVYDLAGSPNQILEELYFWILDYVNSVYGKTDKLVDNFVTSPGSSLFTENLQKRATAEQNVSRIMGNVNEVVKSIVQIIWSVKEYESLLIMYDKYNNSDGSEKDAALMSLKQRWLDKVDIQKGGSSLKQLSITGAQQPNFVFVIDAFMAARSVKDTDKIDLNDRLKRLVKQRLEEFFVWVKDSDKALRQRYLVEKNYLQVQLNSLGLYAHWVKPYLKAARKLREEAEETSALVTGFNTALFELTLMGIGKYDPVDDVVTGDLPEVFKRKSLRNYAPIILLDMRFRSTPEAVGQHARFRGRLEINFMSFALHEDELKQLKKELEKDDLGDLMSVTEGLTAESLDRIRQDVEDILEGKKSFKVEKEEVPDDTNPFSALFSFWKGAKKKASKEDFSKGIPEDDDFEVAVRSQAILDARKKCRKAYNTLKKTYGLPAFAEDIS